MSSVVAEKQQKNSKRGQHLKPHQWPKGHCPNPGGRPKGRTLMSVIREKLSTPDGDESRLENAAVAFIEAMEAGSIQHLKEYIEREEGKVPEEHLHGVRDDMAKVLRDREALAAARILTSRARSMNGHANGNGQHGDN